jgi:PTH1 family peptidyl-tRNA hydrolase
MVAGLGNPGKPYETTRHNTGFMVVDKLAEAYAIDFDKSKFNAIFGRGKVEQTDVILVKPQTYMNRSGGPIKKLADYFRILCKDILIIHDDIDLAFGKLKIKEKGGDGGHKGIRSIMDAFGGGNFKRLRVGIGRSEAYRGVIDHVLGCFNPEETVVLEKVISHARDAAVTVLCEGAKEGMNRFNKKTIITS